MSGKAAFEADKAKRAEERKERIQGEINPLVFKLRDKGFNILPGIVDKKHPIGIEDKNGDYKWGGFQKKFISDDEFDLLCNNNTGLWCIITGEISGNLVVVDFDSISAYNQFFKAEFEDKTMAVKTPSGGIHLYFRYANVADMPKTVFEYNGFPIDIRSNGGIAVAPGSVSNKGKYELLNDLEPMLISDSSLLSRIPNLTKDSSISQGLKRFYREIKKKVDLKEMLDIIGYESKSAGTNDRRMSCIKDPSDKKYKTPVTVYSNWGYWCHKCRVGGDMLDIVRSKMGLSFADGIEWLEEKTDIKCGELKPDVERFYRYKTNQKTGVKTFAGLDLDKIVRYFINEYHLIVSNHALVYWYDKDKGIYRPVTGVIDIELTGLFGALANIHIKKEVKKLILDDPNIQKTDVSIERMFTHKHLFCFVNGIYDRRTGVLSEHTPDEYFMFQIPVKFDPDAKDDHMMNFLQSSFDDWEEEMEWLGYCLTSDNWLERMSFYIGRGNTGTSTWFRIVEKFFDKEFITNVTPHDLVYDERAVLDLLGKSICLNADIGSGKIKKFNKIKTIIGNDSIPARYLYGENFSFVNKSKLMYGMNEVPPLDDKTDSATRRMRWVKMDNQHGKTPNGFEDKLKTSDALSVLLNLAMAGLEKLIDRGDFQEKTKINSVEMDTMAKPIYVFAEELLTITKDMKDDFIYCDTLHPVAGVWRERNGMHEVEYNTFTAEFNNKMMRNGVKKKLVQRKGYRRGYAFFGVRFNEVAIADGYVDHQKANECDSGIFEPIEYENPDLDISNVLEELEF